MDYFRFSDYISINFDYIRMEYFVNNYKWELFHCKIMYNPHDVQYVPVSIGGLSTGEGEKFWEELSKFLNP